MKRFLITAVATLTALLSAAQSNLLSGVTSMRDGEHYAVVENGAVKLYDYATSTMRQVVFDASEHTPSIRFSGYFWEHK